MQDEPGAPSSSYAPSAPPPPLPTLERKSTASQISLKAWLDEHEIPQQYRIRLENFEKNKNAYHVVMVIDNSSSMSTIDKDQTQSRWQELCSRVCDLAKLLGILQMPLTLRFMNTPTCRVEGKEIPKTIVVGESLVEEDAVFDLATASLRKSHAIEHLKEVLFNCVPNGLTPIKETLQEVWRQKPAHKRLLVIVATDGSPQPDSHPPPGACQDYFIDALFHYLKRERKAEQMPITFMACTEDKRVMKYLNDWDKTDVFGNPELENYDVIDDFDSENSEYIESQQQSGVKYPQSMSSGLYILKTLLGSIEKEIGNMDLVHTRKRKTFCNIL